MRLTDHPLQCCGFVWVAIVALCVQGVSQHTAMNTTAKLRVAPRTTQAYNALCISLKHNVVVVTHDGVGLTVFSLTDGAHVRDVRIHSQFAPGCICTTFDDAHVICADRDSTQLQVVSIADGLRVASRDTHMMKACYVDCNKDVLLIGNRHCVFIVSWGSDAVLHTFTWPQRWSSCRPRLVSHTTCGPAFMFFDNTAAYLYQPRTATTTALLRALGDSKIDQVLEDPYDRSILVMCKCGRSMSRMVRLSSDGTTKIVNFSTRLAVSGVAALPEDGCVVLHPTGGFSLYNTNALRSAWIALCATV